MVGSNKILTVSYGTFSCTLEGFDDPFSTMRSIAEYFRDLAADDRYFGAEPPTPDAEMLQSIAEKEIQRRVEARVQENGLVLTQMDEAAQAGSDAPTAATHVDLATETRPSPDTAQAFEDEVDMLDDDLPPAAEVSQIVANPATAETIAEKLNRIRAVVNTASTEQSAEDGADEDASVSAIAEDVAADVMSEDDPFEDDATEHEIAEALSSFDEGEFAQSEDEVVADADAAHPVMETSEPHSAEPEAVEDFEFEVESRFDAQDEIAADAQAEIEDDLPEEHEEEHETDGEAELLSPGADAWAAAEGAETEVAHQAHEMDAEGGASSDVEPIARVVKLAPEAAVESDHVIAEAEANAEVEAQDIEDLERLDGAAEWQADAEDLRAAEPEADHEEDEVHFVAPSVDASLDVEPMDDAPGDVEQEQEEVQAENSAALANDEEDDFAASIRAAIDSSESDDAEAEMDIDGHSTGSAYEEDAFGADTNEDALAAGAIAARERLGTLAEPDEDTADVDRLLEKTNDQMKESEGTRRRSAIAHLKAAVAATKADRLLKRVTTREKTEEEEQTQYREDLAQVVRPRRPSANEATSARPEPMTEGKSPLMLVSELRVDADGNESSVSPVRPKRVSMEESLDGEAEVEASEYENGASFSEFAEKMGATELPDLLEAAAAYAAFVENRPHFSRPQLMKRVARHDPSGEFTREAGLRSFGQLLRQGKIRKLKRGQFTVADTTRFNPDARMAGE